MRRPALLFASALALALMAAGTSSAYIDAPGSIGEPSGVGTPGISQTGNITHVKNIGGWSGSDIEFASREVVKLSNGATGDPVCKTFAEDGITCIEFAKEIRDFAVAGALSQQARIIDITDPANAVVVGLTPCAINQNDIQIYGNLLLVAADVSGSCTRATGGNVSITGSAVLDFSNPRKPTYLSQLSYPTRGSHNHTMMPNRPVAYLSDSDVASTGLGNIPIWDLTDPANPVKKLEFKFGGHSPHDITFNASGTRAYVAAVSLTYILNTEDPFAPTLVSVIPNEGISISHQSDPTPDGDYLLVADEVGGGAAGLSPGGPVHVYDIRNEVRPVKVGTIFDDCLVVSSTCDEGAPGAPEVGTPVSTAHVFRINPDGYTMAIAWYKDGVHVVDFSDIIGLQAAGSGAASLVGPRTIGRMKMPNANTWAAKMWQERHPGYVFANDIRRGLDIFYVSSLGGTHLATGTIHGGNPAVYFAGVGVTRADFETNCEFSPRTNGQDGWVAAVPAAIGDGEHSITARATSNTGFYDMDLYFYDKDCTLLGASEATGSDETGDAPEGTRYVLTASFVDGPVRITLTSGPKVAPE